MPRSVINVHFGFCCRWKDRWRQYFVRAGVASTCCQWLVLVGLSAMGCHAELDEPMPSTPSARSSVVQQSEPATGQVTVTDSTDNPAQSSMPADSAPAPEVIAAPVQEAPAIAPATTPAIHVRAGEDIQAALETAAGKGIRSVIVHEGTYRPTEPGQALIWLNRRHDGIRLRAEGDVTLTAANPEVASRQQPSYPAIVNHVIYCGDGVGPTTVIEGFKITGANNFTTTKGPVIEPATDSALKRTAYFYYDGGGVKIFGRSYPTLIGLEIFDNYSSPCGAGVSIEHRGFRDQHVTIRDCVFRNNRVPLTGAALDLLGDDKGSSAVVENCLFVNNASNCSMDSRSLTLGSWMPKRGHGAITVFAPSKLVMRNCTITGNRNGVDDTSPESKYERCIFWYNNLEGGWVQGQCYETSIRHGENVRDCTIGGDGILGHAKLHASNQISTSLKPQFDLDFVPQNQAFQGIGYRPVTPPKP